MCLLSHQLTERRLPLRVTKDAAQSYERQAVVYVYIISAKMRLGAAGINARMTGKHFRIVKNHNLYCLQFF